MSADTCKRADQQGVDTQQTGSIPAVSQFSAPILGTSLQGFLCSSVRHTDRHCRQTSCCCCRRPSGLLAFFSLASALSLLGQRIPCLFLVFSLRKFVTDPTRSHVRVPVRIHPYLYRAPVKCLYVVARSFFLLLLNCSAWPCLAVA